MPSVMRGQEFNDFFLLNRKDSTKNDRYGTEEGQVPRGLGYKSKTAVEEGERQHRSIARQW